MKRKKTVQCLKSAKWKKEMPKNYKNAYVEAIIRELVLYSSNYPFHPRFTAVEDPGHSARSVGGRLQLNTHTPYVCGFA